MKKFILFALIAVLFSACGDEYYNGVPTTVTKTFSVTDEMWEIDYDDTGAYLQYGFRVPELTNYIFNNGIMEAYLYYKPKGYNFSVLSPLPFSDFIVDNNGYKYEEHITVEFAVGEVTFIVKVDDHEVSELLAYLKHDFVVRFMY